MTKPSVHLRLERRRRRSQLYFDLEGCPRQVLEFCDRARILATELTAALPRTEISGAKALRLAQPSSSWRDLVVAAIVLIVCLVIAWFGR